MNTTRLFYVTDSITENEEIFETKEEAMDSFVKLEGEGAQIYIAEVKNAYREKVNGMIADQWNYDDRSDTFTIIKVLMSAENI
jgi:hypothetical protein